MLVMLVAHEMHHMHVNIKPFSVRVLGLATDSQAGAERFQPSDSF